MLIHRQPGKKPGGRVFKKCEKTARSPGVLGVGFLQVQGQLCTVMSLQREVVAPLTGARNSAACCYGLWSSDRDTLTQLLQQSNDPLLHDVHSLHKHPLHTYCQALSVGKTSVNNKEA